MLQLYKCEHWKPELCNDYRKCSCKCTFDPRHIWIGSEIIDKWVAERQNIEVQCDGCPANIETTVLKFIEEVEDENELTTT